MSKASLPAQKAMTAAEIDPITHCCLCVHGKKSTNNNEGNDALLGLLLPLLLLFVAQPKIWGKTFGMKKRERKCKNHASIVAFGRPRREFGKRKTTIYELKSKSATILQHVKQHESADSEIFMSLGEARKEWMVLCWTHHARSKSAKKTRTSRRATHSKKKMIDTTKTSVKAMDQAMVHLKGAAWREPGLLRTRTRPLTKSSEDHSLQYAVPTEWSRLSNEDVIQMQMGWCDEITAQDHQAVKDMALQDTDESNQKAVKQALTDEQRAASDKTIQITTCEMEAKEIINKWKCLPDDKKRWKRTFRLGYELDAQEVLKRNTETGPRGLKRGLHDPIFSKLLSDHCSLRDMAVKFGLWADTGKKRKRS